ncbi:MAG: DUF4167 domain-containing protein [Pseudomonadota bacterium]
MTLVSRTREAMRPNNPNKRTRGRSRSKNTNPLARSYESNGPDVKIRGSAMQVADKYAQLARDAQSSGDRVMAENYYQHAEHYYRIVAQAYEQNNQGQMVRERRDDGERQNRFEDRQPYRGGDQPTINGFDGLEDDEEVVRSGGRSNGHGYEGSGPQPASADAEAADDQPTVTARGRGGPRANANGRSHDSGPANGAETSASAESGASAQAEFFQPEPQVSEEPPAEAEVEATATAEADPQPVEEAPAPKPRRRTRAPAKRTRTATSKAAKPVEASDPPT